MEKGLEHAFQFGVRGFGKEDQDVDIAEGVKLPSSVAPHGQEGEGRIALISGPGPGMGVEELREGRVKEARSGSKQGGHLCPLAKLLIELRLAVLEPASGVGDGRGHSVSSLRRVRISAPSAVTRSVCSHCAEGL